MLFSLENLQFGYQGEVLLENISFALSEGERVGLIGGNGEGKTTLIKLILGQLSPDGGKVFRKNGIRIGCLEQTGGFDSDKTVFEEMRAVFSREEEALKGLREVENAIAALRGRDKGEENKEYLALAAKYERLNKLVAATDAYGFEVRIRTVLNGMGFEKDYGRVIRTMSGGEKTRLKFCKLLLEAPELLILDEPTNHLDIQTLFWLEDYLSAYKGALLVVSHDRYFLDKTVFKIAELENKRLQEYKGNYSRYKILKAERVAAKQKEYEKQQAEIAHMQEYVERNLVRASTTKMAQSRRGALEKMERVEKPFTPPAPPRFRFTYAEKPYENVLTIEDLTLTAGDKVLFTHGNAALRRGDKCALVGANGTGKSTLIKEIVRGGRQEIALGRLVKIAYYDQENANLHPDATVLEELWGRHVRAAQTDVRAALARAGLGAEDAEKPVCALSGGDRAKLALAVFEAEHGNFLLLDEPTNHLDLPARESLESALKAFDGTVLFVSHDRYFIDAIADKIVLLDAQGMQEFSGGYAQFVAARKKETTEQKASAMPASNGKNTNGGGNRKDRAEEAKKRLRVREIEKEIAALEEEEKRLQEEIASPAVAADYKALQEKCARLEEIRQKSDGLYAEYETLI